MVAFSSASPFPASLSFSPIAFHSFLFSSCSPPLPFLPLFAFVFRVLRKSSLLSFLAPFHDPFHIFFISPYDHLLLPLFHHPASPSHTLLPMSCTRTPGPASAAGCVVLVEKSLSLPGPTSTWDLFCHSVPFICWLKLEAYGNKGTQITHMILPPPPFRPWVGAEGCLHPCPALTTLAAFDNGSCLQYLVLALCKMGAVLQTAWV